MSKGFDKLRHGYKSEGEKQHDAHRREVLKRTIAFFGGAICGAVGPMASIMQNQPKDMNVEDDQLEWRPMPYHGILDGSFRVVEEDGTITLYKRMPDGSEFPFDITDMKARGEYGFFGGTVYVKKDGSRILYAVR